VVFSFGQDEAPLKSIGKFKATVSANSKTAMAEFTVFENVRDNLVGFKTLMELELIKLTYSTNEGDEYEANLIKQFPDLFSGKIGCLKGYQLKLHINKETKPVVQKERKVPFHLKDKIEKAIEEMIRDDIIEQVDGEPTPYVSCFVAVPKPSNPEEMRITLDAKTINKVIERERHNMPTVDKLKAKINDAKLLSKIDLKGGYHQILIHENSRYIT
jgi:hypothetical protein